MRRTPLLAVAVSTAALGSAGVSPGDACSPGVEFHDRGRHALRGIPGEWQLLAVTS